MTDEFVITPDGRDRTVTYSTNPEDSYIKIGITGKEAVDALNATDELVDAGQLPRPTGLRTGLPP